MVESADKSREIRFASDIKNKFGINTTGYQASAARFDVAVLSGNFNHAGWLD